jgi:hypothetical protein
MMLTRTAVIVLAAAAAAAAAVKKIHVVERSDVPGFAYERIVAKAHFAIDPKLEANRIITDIDLAPRNDQGLVEFAADLYVIKPRNPVDGNGTVLFEVSNRGNKGMLGMFDFAASSRDPKEPGDFGDGYLLKQGYTLVWLGWQADVPNEPGILRLFAPVAHRDGQVITGPVRSEWIVDAKSFVYSLGDRNTHIPYPAVNVDDPAAVLTVRDTPYGAKRTIPRESWKFARLENGKAVADPGRVYLATGFEPGRIYEVVYTAGNPTVVGLGPAGVRDLISFFKYDGNGIVLLGEQYRHIKRAIGFGTSQSGRFLRTFLYYGFNRDEKNRKVFDGVWAHVAGGGRGSFNHRFAQPSRDGHPFLNFLYPTDIFPFTDAQQSDPDTGLSGGILARAEKDNVVPKIFYTNGSYEYWGRAASLIHTSVDGKKDVAPAPGTRIYLLSGTQHGPGSFPPRRNNTQNLSNPNDYRFAMRGLLQSMNAWLKDGKEPPPSLHPRVDKDDLVALGAVQFPKIPGVSLPKTTQHAWRADYGPEFGASGVITKEPPALGKPFQVLVPQVDRDGNETAGLRLPDIQAPLGAYTGWNLRTAAIGAPGEYLNMVGSFLPFARTKAERLKNGDPRPSIEERYPTRQAYLDKVRAAAQTLANGGYVLAEDVPLLVERAGKQWDGLLR